jgi:hypothetical protein
MAESETFGIESGFGEKAIEWMNNQAIKNKWKFEARSYNYTVATKNFGSFELFSWIGDVKIARSIIVKVSKRFKVRVIEGGYKPKDKIYKRNKSDYAMVRKGDRIIGHLEFVASRVRNDMWDVGAEERK